MAMWRFKSLSIKPLSKLLAGACMTLFLLACAVTNTHSDKEKTVTLLLQPSTLGIEMSMMQRMHIYLDAFPDKPSPELEVALEADASSVRLAILQLGHTVARLDWDGVRIAQQLAPGWPKVVRAERVLSDLQMVWWPITAIHGALAPDWTVRESGTTREFLHGDRVVTTVKITSCRTIELIQAEEGYRVLLTTDGEVPQFARAALSNAVECGQ